MEINNDFWKELCGLIFLKNLGVSEINHSSLKIFEKEYFKFYPYLMPFLNIDQIKNQRVLEIGLGYGATSQNLAENVYLHQGIDYPENPVKIANQKFVWNNISNSYASVGDAGYLNGLKDDNFNRVVSIGCLHHTRNLEGLPPQETEFTSKKELQTLLRNFKMNNIQLQNHQLRYFRKRNLLLKKAIIDFIGCDWYVTAIK